MLKLAVVIVGLVIAAALAWNAGETHRQNCIRAGRTACSVLPWENGKPKPRNARAPSGPDLFGGGSFSP